MLKAGCSQDWLPHKVLGINVLVEGFWEATCADGVVVHWAGKLGPPLRRGARQPPTGREACRTLHRRPKSQLAESMSCNEFPESVNAARMSACATVRPVQPSVPRSVKHPRTEVDNSRISLAGNKPSNDWKSCQPELLDCIT